MIMRSEASENSSWEHKEGEINARNIGHYILPATPKNTANTSLIDMHSY
jgi:hypothetical protein